MTNAPKHTHDRTGILQGLLAAVLFGTSTTFAKLLLGTVDAVLLAALMYLGAGLGLAVWIAASEALRRGPRREASLARHDLPYLGGAIVAGGVIGPILLMVGLQRTSATTASLLLNLEAVCTTGIAWLVFRENVGPRIAAGFAAILLGGLLLSFVGNAATGVPWGAVAVAGACLCWGVDNNLTRFVSGGDPRRIAAIKGGVAGSVNLALALGLGATLPSTMTMCMAALVGLAGYGLSLVLFIYALRHLGTARTGAYFSTAPFLGALVAIAVLREPVTALLAAAGVFMAVGVWLHLTEHHEHEHRHEAVRHSHSHNHDEHHGHAHDLPVTDVPHAHEHLHDALRHSHPHYPDLHHRHSHA